MLDKKLLKEYSTKTVKVYSIPQTQIIGHVGVKFTGGGHSRVYSEIPDGEIWIARELMSSLEGKYYILHEWYEFNKMGQGMSYDDAHVLANRVEGKARKDHHENLDILITNEVLKHGDRIAGNSIFNGAVQRNADSSIHHQHHRTVQRTEKMRNNKLMIVK
jgi:hypothetical protein